ncbi:MAG: DUF3313 family protein [Myxococcota bacterium]
MTSDALVFRAPRTVVLAATLWLLTAGCAAIRTPDPGPPAPLLAPSGGELVEVDTGGRGIFLIRPDHELGRYDEILIEHVGFQYSPNQRWLSHRHEDRINEILATAIEGGGQDGAVGVTDEAGPCVLGVRFYVTDLELHAPEEVTGSTQSFVRSFGRATMILELTDSESDETLARFLQKRDLGSGPAHGMTGTSLHRLGQVVDFAMRDMGRQLQKITPPTSSGWNAACRGTIAKAAADFR